jgi:hypothetical protein
MHAKCARHTGIRFGNTIDRFGNRFEKWSSPHYISIGWKILLSGLVRDLSLVK